MRIYLLRHGETDWNREKYLLGAADNPLNEYGRQLAVLTGEALKEIPFQAAFCSPLSRARETAEIILTGRNIPLVKDDRLKEIDFGVEEGKRITEIKSNPDDPVHNFFLHPEAYIPPDGGETMTSLYERSSRFMKDRILPLEREYDTVLIVAHGAYNRSILNPLAGISLKDFWQISLPNCAVSILSLEDGVLRIEEEGKIYY